MWRKTKKDLSVSDASHREEESHSPRANSHHSPGGISHSTGGNSHSTGGTSHSTGGHSPSTGGSSHSPRVISHRLAHALLRPFTRKSHHEQSPRRTRSDTQLLGQKSGQALRLSRSSLEETRVPKTRAVGSGAVKTRAAEISVPETRVAETSVPETRVAETRVPETRAAQKMELAPRVEVREVQKVSAIPPASTNETKEVGISPVASVNAPQAADVIADASTLSTPGALEGMSQQMISELTSAFKYFDHNSDGSIDREELGAVLKSLGDRPTDEELDAMIAAVDQNGDGCISLSEFLDLNKRALEAGLGGDDDKELRATFNVFDLDGNGFISCEELQQVLSNLLGEPVVKADCFRMIQGVDQDGDGQVNFQEFHTMMQQAMPC